MQPTLDAVFMTLLLLAAATILYGTAAAILARIYRLPEPGVERIDVELPSVGHRIALYHYPPENRRFREPLLLCHGLGANRFNMDFTDDGTGSDRLSLARALQRAGFDTWLVELRGRGNARVPKGADWSADEEVAEDLPTAIETVLDLTGAERLFWVGHSWGGIVQYLLHARNHPAAAKVAGIVTIASPATLRFQQVGAWMFRLPGLFLVYFGLRVPLALLGKIGLPISWVVQLVGSLFLLDLRAMDGRVIRRVFASLADDLYPGVTRQGLEWLKNGYFCTADGCIDEEAYEHIDKPLLLVAAGHDRVAPPASISHLTDFVSSKDVTLQIFDRYGHGSILLGRDAPDEVFPVIRGWLAARATRVTQISHREHGKNGSPKSNGTLG
jgi:pimeloyl-ACP methyl ester carboxylesterase